MDTRTKIIQEATRLFNKEGYTSVSLLEISQQLKISRGNLTYHFKDKEALLEAIVKEMWDKIQASRSEARKLPSFENLHNEVQRYYKFQKDYAFIFLDRHLLNHPGIKTQFRMMTQQTIADNVASIAFSVELGNMRAEAVKGTYYNIAFITWMLTFFWLPQQIIRGEKTTEDGEKMIWSILLPHFTEKGVNSFRSFFGEEYLETLGEPFESDLAQIINF